MSQLRGLNQITLCNLIIQTLMYADGNYICTESGQRWCKLSLFDILFILWQYLLTYLTNKIETLLSFGHTFLVLHNSFIH